MRPSLFAALLFVAALVAFAARPAHADECHPVDSEGRTLTACFDPGNRWYVTATTAQVGTGIVVRHAASPSDPAITYRLEHTLASGSLGFDRASAGLYELRFIRHSTTGHIVFATNPPRQIRLPFDVGLFTRLGRAELEYGSPTIDVNLVTLAPLADFARSADARFRLAIGPLARWDATVSRTQKDVASHAIAPFTMGVFSGYAESKDGLTLGRVHVEGGALSSAETGFLPAFRAEGSVERVLLAVNEQPISLYAAGRFDAPSPRVLGEVGLRIALVSAARK